MTMLAEDEFKKHRQMSELSKEERATSRQISGNESSLGVSQSRAGCPIKTK